MYCRTCGAANLGTAFCESCGAPAMRADAPTPAPAAVESAAPTPEPAVTPSPAAEPRAAAIAPAQVPLPPAVAPGVGATPARAFALIFFLISGILPGLIDFWIYAAGNYVPQASHIVSVILIIITALFSLGAAAAGRASPGGKAAGVLLPFVYAGVAVFLVYGGVPDYTGYTNDLLLGIVYFSLFLSWALGRPFRGPGFFGLLIALVVGVLGALVVFIPGVGSNYAGSLAIQDVIFALSVWLVVGLSVAFEGKPSGVVARPRALPTSPFNERAKLAFGFVMGLIGVEVLAVLGSLSALYWLAFLSFVAPVLVVLGLVFGHLALAQLRHTGQQGRGYAVAAVVICYVAIALSVVAILVQVFTVLALTSSYGGE